MNTIGTQIGGKASNVAPGAQTLELQAVKTHDDTGACEAALTGTTVIDISFECEDPTSCATSPLAFSGISLPTNANAAVQNYARSILPQIASMDPNEVRESAEDSKIPTEQKRFVLDQIAAWHPQGHQVSVVG